MRARKLVKLGSSLFVSVPLEWARSAGLTKGSSVVVVEDKGSGGLLVLPRHPAPKSRATISGNALVSKMLAAYLSGCGEVEVLVGDASREELRSLDSLASSLVGVEKVFEDSSRIVYSCFVDDKQEPEKIAGRIVDTLSGMIVDAAAALDSSDRDRLTRAASRDSIVNKLYFLLVRVLRSSSTVDKVKLMDYRLLAKTLERIGDELSLLARRAPDRWAPTSVASYAVEISSMLRRSFELFVSEDLEAAASLGSEAWSLSCELYRKASALKGFRSHAYMTYSTISGLVKDVADLAV